MRKVEQAGIALAVGGLFYLGSHTMTEGLSTNPDAVRAPAKACAVAAHLGKSVVKATEIPQPCEQYRYSFAHTTTTIEGYDPSRSAGNTYNVTSTTTYSFPTKDAFESKIYTEGIDDSRLNHERRLVIDYAFGLAGVVLIAAAQRQQQRQAEDQHILETWLKDDSNS